MMQWELVVALVIAIPIILFPAAYVWYINISGIAAAVKQAKEKRVAREENAELQVQYERALTEALIKRYPRHYGK